MLPEDADEVADITGLYVARFPLLLAGKRIFIQTVQQINGWRGPGPFHCPPATWAPRTTGASAASRS